MQVIHGVGVDDHLRRGILITSSTILAGCRAAPRATLHPTGRQDAERFRRYKHGSVGI